MKKIRTRLSIVYPDIVVVDDFLSPQECAFLIKQSKPKLEPSAVVANNDPEGILKTHPERTSCGTYFDRRAFPMLATIEDRIQEFTGYAQPNTEPLQLLNYKQGGEYKPHYDYFDETTIGGQAHLKRGGNRIASMIMYLNTPESGGATVFPDLGLRVGAEAGAAIFFKYPNPKPESLTLHGGEIVTAGEKWIATKWFRANEFI